jgi:hypothetical protein
MDPVFWTSGDTVGEFPAGSVWPELGQDGFRWEGKTAAIDAPDEFVDGISSLS